MNNWSSKKPISQIKTDQLNPNQLNDFERKQFLELINNQRSKLSANDLTKLNKSLFTDYLRNVKYHAGTCGFRALQKNSQNRKTTRQFNSLKGQRNIVSTKTILNKNISSKNSDSYYYCQKNELLSLKEFIILMAQARKKSNAINRVRQRKEQKQLVQSIGRKIQSAGINMRLTSSYAHRIAKQQIKKDFDYKISLYN